MTLAERFAHRVAGPIDLRTTVVAIGDIPYARPSVLTADAVVDEWRGTCSTKHLLLRELADELWPEVGVRIWHRVYVVTKQLALKRWGEQAAGAVPSDGLVDVHCYTTAKIDGRDVRIDATFPISDWDGTSDLPLWCGPGEDFPSGDDPVGSKAELTKKHCDPDVREPFIAALTRLRR